MKLGCLIKRRESMVMPVPPEAALHQLFSVPEIGRVFAGEFSVSDIFAGKCVIVDLLCCEY